MVKVAPHLLPDHCSMVLGVAWPRLCPVRNHMEATRHRARVLVLCRIFSVSSNAVQMEARCFPWSPWWQPF